MTIRVETDTRVLDRMIDTCKGEPARIVHDGTSYGVYQEMGWTTSTGSSVAPRPAAGNAVETVRPAYERGWRQVKNLEAAEDFVEKVARDLEGTWKQNIITMRIIDTGNYLNSIAVHRPEDIPGLRWNRPSAGWVNR